MDIVLRGAEIVRRIAQPIQGGERMRHRVLLLLTAVAVGLTVWSCADESQPVGPKLPASADISVLGQIVERPDAPGKPWVIKDDSTRYEFSPQQDGTFTFTLTIRGELVARGTVRAETKEATMAVRAHGGWKHSLYRDGKKVMSWMEKAGSKAGDVRPAVDDNGDCYDDLTGDVSDWSCFEHCNAEKQEMEFHHRLFIGAAAVTPAVCLAGAESLVGLPACGAAVITYYATKDSWEDATAEYRACLAGAGDPIPPGVPIGQHGGDVLLERP